MLWDFWWMLSQPASSAEAWGFPSGDFQHTMPPKKDQSSNQSNGEELVHRYEMLTWACSCNFCSSKKAISKLLWNYLWTMWTLGLTNWPGRHRSWEAACNPPEGHWWSNKEKIENWVRENNCLCWNQNNAGEIDKDDWESTLLAGSNKNEEPCYGWNSWDPEWKLEGDWG